MRQLVTDALPAAETLSRSSYAVSRSSYRLRRGLEAGMVGEEVSFTHHEALRLFEDQFDFAPMKL
jgi:hypothetical protein